MQEKLKLSWLLYCVAIEIGVGIEPTFVLAFHLLSLYLRRTAVAVHRAIKWLHNGPSEDKIVVLFQSLLIPFAITNTNRFPSWHTNRSHQFTFTRFIPERAICPCLSFVQLAPICPFLWWMCVCVCGQWHANFNSTSSDKVRMHDASIHPSDREYAYTIHSMLAYICIHRTK